MSHSPDNSRPNPAERCEGCKLLTNEKKLNADERMKTMLAVVPFAAHFWDSDHNLIDCNQEILDLLDVKDKDSFINSFFCFVPDHQAEGVSSRVKWIQMLDMAFKEGRQDFEWLHKTVRGEVFPTAVTLVRVENEDFTFITAYTRDLRMYRKHESELSIAHRLNELQLTKLNLVVTSTKIGLWDMEVNPDDILNPDNPFIYSDELRALLGFESEKDFPNVISSFESRIHPDDRQKTNDMLIRHILDKTGGTPFDTECRVMKKNGEYGCYRTSGSTIRDDDGNPVVAAGALIDITDLKNTITETQKLREQAENANKAKSSFLSAMSHEMRTPLNAVIGLAGLSLDSSDETEIYANLEKIYNAGTTLLSLVNDLLDISKIEAGMFTLIEAVYDVSSLINDTVTQNLLRLGEKPIKLHLDVDENLYSQLKGDELRVKQIINNLLSNAIKYTDEGAITLKIRTDESKEKPTLTIEVSDTGRGIRQEDLSLLFADYMQFDLEHNRKTEGTGLGLPITRNLAQMMGGSISVESEFGKGSVFTVKIFQGFVTNNVIGHQGVQNLKNFRYSDSKRRRSSRIKRIRIPYARVLVVDDNATNLDVARGLMGPYGMAIDCVLSGAEAVAAIKNEKTRYNAVFMDHMMPGMDGIETTKQIRALATPYAAEIPVIALTANAISGNEDMFLEAGFNDYLTKPIDIPKLDEVIHRWLRDKELEKKYDDSLHEADQDSCESVLPVIDGLDTADGVRQLGGNTQTYINILRSYATSTRKLLDSLENGYEKHINDYSINVHSVKGTSMNIGAVEIGKSAAALEKAAKDGNIDYIRTHNPDFIAVLRKLLNDLDNALSDMNSAAAKPVISRIDKSLLNRLATACEAYDMDAVDAVTEVINAYEYAQDAELAAWLRENTDLMNFDEIAEYLRKNNEEE